MATATCLEHVNQRLNACRATSIDQDVNQICDRWEKVLINFVEGYRDLCACNEGWRDDVFRGVCEFDPNRERQIKDAFEAWLAMDEHLQKCIGFLCSQRHEPGMRIAADYQHCLTDAKDTIANWTCPDLSADPILRETTLNRDQSRKIKQMLGSDW